MKQIKKINFILLVLLVIIFGYSMISFADTTVISTGGTPYFHTGAGPIASIFYWIGDVLVLPFRLVGNLFS